MASTIHDDLQEVPEVQEPELIENLEVREERALTELSMAPEGLALPASVAVSRKNTQKIQTWIIHVFPKSSFLIHPRNKTNKLK